MEADLGRQAAFSTLGGFSDLLNDLPQPDASAARAASARDAVLTKPPGALGRLEEIAKWYAGWRGQAAPRVSAPQITIFAGNHGVTAQGISAFPAEVTHQMVANFASGGAAINQLAKLAGARLDVIELELETPVQDFTKGPAMDEAAFLAALQAGYGAVSEGSDLFIAGEMGIGNTTSAAAIAYGLYGGAASDWAGAGTGLDAEGVSRKAQVLEAGRARHGALAPLEVLRCFGGREIAAMAGAYVAARQRRIPVILDGFIATAAAAALHEAAPGALDHALAGHRSDEQAHARLLSRIGKEPVLDLGLRLGEGSGAALAIQIVRAALECHSGMATFAEAGVSDGG